MKQNNTVSKAEASSFPNAAQNQCIQIFNNTLFQLSYMSVFLIYSSSKKTNKPSPSLLKQSLQKTLEKKKEYFKLTHA